MPYIETKTNVKVTEEQKKELKAVFADAIELIPGKSEEWLMLGFSDGMTMAFRGDIDSPAAMIEIDVFGKSTESAYAALTERVCDEVSRVLAVSPDRIYVKYRECNIWGYNGFNF